MEGFLQHVLNGLLLGGTYALLGIGLTLIFGLMSVVNFAHGEFYTLGAYMTYATIAVAGLPFVAGVLVAIAVGMLLGALAERVLLRPLGGASIDTVMLVMIGLWITMQNSELLAWGGVAKAIEHPFPTEPVGLGPVSVAPLRLFVLGAVLLLILGSHLLINRTRVGTAMRATFQDRETAALMGIDVPRIHTLTFAFGSGLAAAAGALLRLRLSRLSLHGRSGLSESLLRGHPRWSRQRHWRAAGWPHPRSGRRVRRWLHLVGLPGRGGLHHHHCRAGRSSLRTLRPRRARRMSGWRRGGAVVALLVVLATVPGWVTSPYYLHIAIMAAIFSILALSMNLLLGYTGQLSLGHAAFFGIGAYASALLTFKLDWPFLLGFLAALILPGLTGYAIGRLALRLRGAYFVLVTISFAGVVSLVSVNWIDLTNGPLGCRGFHPPRSAASSCAARRRSTTSS